MENNEILFTCHVAMNEIQFEVFSLTVAEFRQIQGIVVKLFFPLYNCAKLLQKQERPGQILFLMF